MDGRSSESNRRKERDMQDDRRDQGEQQNTALQQLYRQKKTATWENCGQSNEVNGGGTIQKVR